MTLDAGFRPLQLPRREAPNMQAELAPGPDGRARVFSEERLVRNDSSFEEVGGGGDGGDYDPADDRQS